MQPLGKTDKKDIWKLVLDSVKVALSEASFKTWVSKTHLASIRKVDTTRYIAEVGCDTVMVRQYVQERYFGLLQEALIKAIGAPCDLTFTIKTDPERVAEPTGDSAGPLFEETDNSEALMRKMSESHIRPYFTFANFAVSGSNQLAWAAAEAVAKSPGNAYNPLFIWGGVGVGKTHLMHAVGITMFKKSLNAKVLAVTGEDFTNDIVQGIRSKNTHEVRAKYRKLDALFVDDVQFIAGKDTAQEEFFHTFNAVTSAGGQIIMTSDRPPTEIKKLEDRLRSRFEAGLIVDISQPDFELRCAITQIKAEQKGINLESTLVHLIAANTLGARQIEGFLVRLSSELLMRKADPDEELIKKLLTKGEGEVLVEKTKEVSTDKLIDAVCKHYQINKRQILGNGRSRMISYPRHILMYLLRMEMQVPYEELGQVLGGRDHSTIMHGVNKIASSASTDPDIRRDIEGIKALL
jgi:chromosomal replication initiator protein